MSASGRTAATATGGARLAPLDILYLDRPRLTSYASQLYDGEPAERQIRDWQTYVKHEIGGAVDSEESTTTTSEGSAGVNAGLHLSGKAMKAKLEAQRKRGARREIETTDGAEEHTTLNVRDNLLVAFLDDMRNSGWLKSYDPASPKAGLFEFTGHMRFFDWSAIQRVLNSWKSMHDALKELSPASATPMGFSDKTAKVISSFSSMIGLEGFHLQMDAGAQIVAPLAIEHLRITREQMMVAYMRDEAIRGTLVAYLNPSEAERGPGFGLSKQVQFGGLLSSFLGNSVRVLPLAIYFPIAGPE